MYVNPSEKGYNQPWAQLFFFFFFWLRKTKVRLKSHLLKPEASFKTLPSVSQNT